MTIRLTVEVSADHFEAPVILNMTDAADVRKRLGNIVAEFIEAHNVPPEEDD